MTNFDVPTDFYPAEKPHGLLLFVPALRSVAQLAARVDADVRSLPAESPGSPHAAWARHPEATVDPVVGWLRQRRVV